MLQPIALPLEETLRAEALNKSHGASHGLKAPEGFQNHQAWELANLIRIAYGDYVRFDQQKDLQDLIRVNDTILLPSEGSSGLVTQCWLSHASDQSPSALEEPRLEAAMRYKVLATFTYLAFNLDLPPSPEVDRFGFILERETSDNNRNLYIVFRGTMEPSEWFNDFQYKQIPFLMPDQDFANMGEICMGFNKIYTDYRPGLLVETKTFNKYSRWLDEKLRDAIMAENPQICQQHELSMKDTLQQTLDALAESGNPPSSIHVAGHSLGAALATICALHAAVLCERKGLACPVSLYTFASPRVGNSDFAKACNEKINAFRIANSEDVVPGIPPATLRVVGEEMSPGPHVDSVRAALAALTGGVSNEVFEHVGAPVYFTLQLGEISSNHNMAHTYCSPLVAFTPASTPASSAKP